MNAPEPGPWEVEALRDSLEDTRYWVVAPPQHGGRYGLVIATDVGGQTQDQAKAHAYILAASSEMLKALKEMRILLSHLKHHDVGAEKDMLDRLIDTAESGS